MTRTTSLQTRYHKESRIVSRKIAGECILVPISSKGGDLDSIYTLNEVGAFIWELIDGEKRLAQIKEIIVDEFEVGPERAEKDLEEFVLQLEQVGAVRSV